MAILSKFILPSRWAHIFCFRKQKKPKLHFMNTFHRKTFEFLSISPWLPMMHLSVNSSIYFWDCIMLHWIGKHCFQTNNPQKRNYIIWRDTSVHLSATLCVQQQWRFLARYQSPSDNFLQQWRFVARYQSPCDNFLVARQWSYTIDCYDRVNENQYLKRIIGLQCHSYNRIWIYPIT